MSENPYRQPAVDTGPTTKTPERLAFATPASLFSRLFSAAVDLAFLASMVGATIWLIIIYDNNSLKVRVGVAFVGVFFMCLQGLPAYFRGATVGMLVLALQIDTHRRPGLRSLMILIFRNLGMFTTAIAIVSVAVGPEVKEETVSFAIGMIYAGTLLLVPPLQIIAGLFVFGKKRLTLHDRITDSRVVYTGRPV